MQPQVVIYTDGSSRGNPGPGGYGAVLQFRDSTGELHSKEMSAGFRRTTNNRMELLAAIVALEALRRPCEVELFSDSQYLVRAWNERWIDGWVSRGWKNASKQPVKNVDLWQRLIAAAEPHTISWHWVEGHAGNELNERCDELATTAADADGLPADEVFEQQEATEHEKG